MTEKYYTASSQTLSQEPLGKLSVEVHFICRYRIHHLFRGCKFFSVWDFVAETRHTTSRQENQSIKSYVALKANIDEPLLGKMVNNSKSETCSFQVSGGHLPCLRRGQKMLQPCQKNAFLSQSIFMEAQQATNGWSQWAWISVENAASSWSFDFPWRCDK